MGSTHCEIIMTASSNDRNTVWPTDNVMYYMVQPPMYGSQNNLGFYFFTEL